MPVTFSSQKALRRDRRRHNHNQEVKLNLRKEVSKFKRKPSKQALSTIYRLLDRASKKKLFHPNKAARLKSSLASQLRKNK